MTRKGTDSNGTDSGKVLIYGIGNPGRQDDALGILLVDAIGQWISDNGLQHIFTDQNYQLNIEDADHIAGYDLVIFADASIIEISDYLLEKVEPDLRADFSMHSVEPSFVVGLCQQMFGKTPDCYQLHIKGYEFEFMGEPSDNARANLDSALHALKNFLLSHSPVY